ncbi:hypothetical protein HYPSUDRAFT_57431 [Hypholoma sublateritium FD-334 SS-4]|uniref:Uncharacterized protein n=1 Tax=Hypholoma sublateritium (strain FD-334 SS-4) TaxID=945553 RepID=A0A0D2NMH4_HYPSF|nr:hypothetical protein HYPSUDRAFT_57431 [Hypholoma sublateritium FD-334 SS-4]
MSTMMKYIWLDADRDSGHDGAMAIVINFRGTSGGRMTVQQNFTSEFSPRRRRATARAVADRPEANPPAKGRERGKFRAGDSDAHADERAQPTGGDGGTTGVGAVGCGRGGAQGKMVEMVQRYTARAVEELGQMREYYDMRQQGDAAAPRAPAVPPAGPWDGGLPEPHGPPPPPRGSLVRTLQRVPRVRDEDASVTARGEGWEFGAKRCALTETTEA